MDQKLLDSSKLDRSVIKKVNIMKKEILIFDPIDKYIYWFIPKFTFITKRAIFTPEWLTKMIIGDSMISQEKHLLIGYYITKKLYLYRILQR